MKKNRNQSGFGLFQLLLTMAVIALLAALLLPTAAQAQVTSQNLKTLSNLTSPFTSTNTVTATTNKITVVPGKGLGLQLRLSGPATSLPSGLWIFPSVDGTNKVKNPWVWTNGIAVSTTHDTYVTNFSAAQLAGITALYIQLTNGTGLALTNNVMYQIDP